LFTENKGNEHNLPGGVVGCVVGVVGTGGTEERVNMLFLIVIILAYGWRAGNLNCPIRIQQAGEILVA